MAVVAQSGTPLDGATSRTTCRATYPSWIPVDTRLTPLGNEVRLMTHLHGGFVAADSDGNPAVTPNGFGPGETQSVFYTNQLPQMPASLLWFHDHGLGATRLNVFAGLAAAYILRDEFDTGGEPNPIGIPGGAYEIPLVVQDRQFNADGTFLYPTSDIPGATWIGEYFGDVMLVNGKVWPFLDVEPRMYRFRILNGCNARILNLDIGGATLWQIGAEGGMWDVPVPVKQLVLAPAERADVLVDFSRFAGADAGDEEPQAAEAGVDPGAAARAGHADPGRHDGHPARARPRSRRACPGAPPTCATPVADALHHPQRDRPGRGRLVLEPERRALRRGHRRPRRRRSGTVEDWVYINMTGDTHPMHTHLVTFQVIGRTPFDVEAYEEANGGPNGVPGGIDPTPVRHRADAAARPEERGFKDTVKANPGYFTTIRAKFDLPTGVTAPQTYVYHCHIVEHEDNDMMRPFTVVP